MPYTPSQSWLSFNKEIDKMISVIKATFQNNTINADSKDYVLCCCIMLGSAKIEVYLEDFFDNWIQKINNSGLNSGVLPNNMKAVFLNQSFLNIAYKKLLTENNESHFIEAISKQLNNQHFNLTDDSKPIPRLDSKKIYQNKKYPTPDNMKALFKRVGFNNIFNDINRLSKSDLQALLQSYNDFRTAIAHSGIPVGINEKDVIEKLKDIKRVIRYIDKALYLHLDNHSINITW